MVVDELLEACGTASALGPESVVVVREPRRGTVAIVVVDNTARGPAIGGVRMAPDLDVGEVARLARAMTLKNAAAGLRHGGAKAGIVADPAMDPAGKESVLRWFARAIADLRAYVPGPDMGTDERCMAWVHDEIGRSVGLPAALGGIPLDELGATGFGLAVAAEALDDAGVLALRGARVAIQGFGAVGAHAARFLAERGALVVAVSDSAGGVADPSGLPVAELVAWKAAGHPVGRLPGATPVSHADVLAADCDLLIPAARPDVVDDANAGDVKARVVLPGANIAVTASAEAILHERGVLCLPDWIVNAGGVICGAVELAGLGRAAAFDRIDATIRENVATLLAATADGTLPRAAAERLAVARVEAAMALRRRY